MTDRVFVDTNVVVYAFDAAEPDRREIALELLGGEALGGRESRPVLVLSTQVLQEFYVTVVHKLERPLDEADAYQAVRSLSRLQVVHVDPEMVLSGIVLSQKHRLSLWDALIVRAAQTADCSRLLSEDLQHDRSFGSLVVENPFREVG
ncbi:MAG: PIN domain-containing protein [Acidobacteriota bacterium]